MRILNVIRFPIGGIRSYLRYTYSRFDPAVYESAIVTVDRPEAQLLPEGMAPLRVTLTTVPETRALIGLSVATWKLVRSGRFELVHSQGTTAAIVSDFAARWHGVPHVVTLHETFRAEQFSSLAGRLKRHVLSRVLGRAKRVIAVSQDARDNLIQHVLLDTDAVDRVQVIQNGVAIDIVLREAAQGAPGLVDRRGADGKTTLLGFVGRFMPEKGFGVLIDAVSLLRERSGTLPPFLIVAVNDGAFLREYRERVSQLGLEQWFHFVGFQASAAGTLAELDAVIMPSLREACPLVAMEAMVLGCPLIASDCIGLRELTAGAPALQSRAGDAASLAAAIRSFLEQRDQNKAHAHDYTGAARDRFDSRRAAADLAAVFAAARAS